MKNKLCVAIGDFDGVHLGHRQLLDLTVKNKLGLVPAVYTFSENCKGSKVITTRAEKEVILKGLGIKQIIFDKFENIKDLTAQKFIREIICKRLNAKMLVCGKDFKFGKDAAADVGVLENLCKESGIELSVSDSFYFRGKKLSSSDIRLFISQGDMTSVCQALGRNYTISGSVTHGKHMGSENKVPTVNIALDDSRAIPAYGVYITKTHIGTVEYESITNVGVRPSVENSGKPNMETNIFDFRKDIYDEDITVEFIKMIRPEIKFKNSAELYKQISSDVQTAKKYFSGDCK